MMQTTPTPNVTKYNVEFRDPGMQPREYVGLNEKAVAAALEQERKNRNYTRALVRLNGNVVQFFERELGCDEWYAHQQQGLLAHLGKATSRPVDPDDA